MIDCLALGLLAALGLESLVTIFGSSYHQVCGL